MWDKLLLFGGESKIIANGSKFKMAFHIALSTEIFPKDAEIGECYYCCEPCRSEHVFKGSGKLFNDAKPYTFVPVFGKTCGYAFRVGMMAKGINSRSEVRDGSFMGGHTPILKRGIYRQIGKKGFKIAAECAGRGETLIARTIVSCDDATECIIDYPCKTINFDESQGLIQVDTGPIVILYKKEMRLAYAAFFRNNQVNFIMKKLFYTNETDYLESAVFNATNIFYCKE